MSDTALVIGEALIDVVMRDGRTLGEHVGGSPLNVAVGLARLGRSVDFLTWIGNDPGGRWIADHVHASGAHLADGSVAASHTATALATLHETGTASYLFDLDWRLSRDAITHEPCVVHTGSIATVLQPGASAVAAIVDKGGTSATITFDPTVRPPLIDAPNAARARVAAMVARADVVKASDEDLRWLEPGTAAEDVAARWLSMGPSVVAVTLGAQGAFAVCAAGVQRVP